MSNEQFFNLCCGWVYLATLFGLIVAFVYELVLEIKERIGERK